MTHRVESFFDPVTSTWSHVLWDPVRKCAAIIDPVLDFDPESGRSTTTSADRLIQFLAREKLRLEWILDTHAHADHLSSAQYIKQRAGGVVAIGEGIKTVQHTFSKIFNLGGNFAVDGRQFDRLIADGETLTCGDLEISAFATPGHTSDSMSFKTADSVFIGDTMFSPAYGTARCDFPGGDAADLYQSISQLLALPDDTRLFLCHDYPAEGKAPVASAKVSEQKQNVHLGPGVSEADFVAMRTQRDAGLNLPRLLLPAIQVNIRAGHWPDPEDNGISYLKIPVNDL